MKQLYSLFIFLCLAAAVSAQNVVTVAGIYSDAVYVPARDALYAIRPSIADNGNSLCRIDPVTGEVLECFTVGEDPSIVVATTSGNYLYLGFRGETSVRRFDLTTNAVDLEFSTGGFEDFQGPFYPESILPLRGSDELVAIARRNDCCYPRHEGVAIYENGRQLPNAVDDYNGSNSLAYTEDDRVIIGYNNETDYQLRRMVITEFGIEDVTSSSGFGAYNGRIEYAGGYLYANNGELAQLIDGYPKNYTYAYPDGFYDPYNLAVEAVPATGRIYYLGAGYDGSLRMQVRDQTTLSTVTSYPIIQNNYNGSGGRTLLQLGGETSFAFVTTENKLGIITLCTSEVTQAPPPYAGPQYICEGQPLALIAPDSARQPGQEILWSDGQKGDTVLVTVAGEYSYRVADAGGCPGPASPSFTVYESYSLGTPAYIIQPRSTVICAGGSITLSAEYYYGQTIIWNTGDTTPVITVTEPGTYTARGIEEYTGCPSAPSEPVQVTAVSSAAPAPPVVDQGLRIDTCTTREINLSVNEPALNYFWTFEYAYTTQAREGDNVITVYPTYEPVRFTVAAQDFNGCLSRPTEGLINFLYPPDATTIQYNASNGTLASSLPGPLVWYYQDEFEGESSGRFYKPLRNGFYSARVKGTRCLSGESNFVSVTGITTATVDDEASRRVEIFPNPTRDQLFVNFDRSLLSELPRGGVKYQLFSADGKLVSHGTVDPSVANAPISVAGLAGGVYLLTFTSDQQAILRKRITVL